MTFAVCSRGWKKYTTAFGIPVWAVLNHTNTGLLETLVYRYCLVHSIGINLLQLFGIRTEYRELRLTTTARCGSSITAFRFVEETGSHVGFELHVNSMRAHF